MVDKLESIRGCIRDQFVEAKPDELDSTKTWLEGWICGVTDFALTENHSLKDRAMAILAEEWEQYS